MATNQMQRTWGQAQQIEMLASLTGLGKVQARNVYRAFNEEKLKKLKGGFRVTSPIEIESLERTKPRKAREGHNPRTGEKIRIPAQPAGWKMRSKLTADAKQALTAKPARQAKQTAQTAETKGTKMKRGTTTAKQQAAAQPSTTGKTMQTMQPKTAKPAPKARGRKAKA